MFEDLTKEQYIAKLEREIRKVQFENMMLRKEYGWLKKYEFGDWPMWINLFRDDGPGFSKTTDAMVIPGSGCVLRTTLFGNVAAQAMVFVPGVAIIENEVGELGIVNRRIVAAPDGSLIGRVFRGRRDDETVSCQEESGSEESDEESTCEGSEST